MRVWAPQKVFQHQPDAVKDQLAPVVNTWYEILTATANVRLYALATSVETTGETIEVRLTIDGVVYTGASAHSADQIRGWYKDPRGGDLVAVPSGSTIMFSGHLEGRTVKVEMRKTTAAGAGTLHGRVTYAKM